MTLTFLQRPLLSPPRPQHSLYLMLCLMFNFLNCKWRSRGIELSLEQFGYILAFEDIMDTFNKSIVLRIVISRFQKRKIIYACLCLSFFAFLLFTFANQIATLLLVLFLASAWKSVYFSVMNTAISQSSSPSDQGKVFGLIHQSYKCSDVLGSFLSVYIQVYLSPLHISLLQSLM